MVRKAEGRVRARLLLWCRDVLAGGVTARRPERESRTGEWSPQGIASSFLFRLVGKGLWPRVVGREPAIPWGRAGGDMRKSYFLERWLPIWKTAPLNASAVEICAGVRALFF